METPLLKRAKALLSHYFTGDVTHFDLPIRQNGSAYQIKVWRIISHIPYGKVAAYNDVASLSGGNARSVGNCCSTNAIPILIPCHRVVGKNSLRGYSAESGLLTKSYLLTLERGRCF